MEFVAVAFGCMFFLLGIALVISSIAFCLLAFPKFEKAYFLYKKTKNQYKK